MLPDPITNQICYKNSYHIPDYTFGFNSEVDYMFTHKFDNMIDHNPNSNQHHTAKVMFLLTYLPLLIVYNIAKDEKNFNNHPRFFLQIPIYSSWKSVKNK